MDLRLELESFLMTNTTQYLLVPAMPTPNGPLHLGHVSGPYLRMDVLTRHLRRRGNHVAFISASDGWETHVLPKALAAGAAAEKICTTYHRQIEDCFSCLGIEFDRFFNPLNPEYVDRANQIYSQILAEMIDAGQVAFRNEKVPFSTKYQKFILGSFIGGHCPQCGVDDLGGFYCEDCGLEASPEDLGHVWSELPDDDIEWRHYDSAFLKVDDPERLRSAVEQRCSDKALVDLAFSSLRHNKGATRLTHPGDWGAPARHSQLSPESIIFSYPGMYCLSLLCGEIAAKELGLHGDPFSKDSNVITVKSFGYDNTAPYLLAATSIGLHSNRYKPFEHYLTNHFATLDGRKFSTSAAHAIWANEALEVLGTDTSTLRAYMCQVNPQYSRKDFSTTQFAQFSSSWGRQIQSMQHEGSQLALTPAAAAHLLNLYVRQQIALEPKAFDLAAAFSTVSDWLDFCALEGKAYPTAFALLAYPFVPQIAIDLTRRHGSALPTARDAEAAFQPEWQGIIHGLEYVAQLARPVAT